MSKSSAGCIAQYRFQECFVAVLRDWNGTHGAPGDDWKLLPSPSKITLLCDLKKLASKIKAHGKFRTILTEMFRTLSSGGRTIGNTIDPTMSIPGALLPAGSAACRDPLLRQLRLRRPAQPP